MEVFYCPKIVNSDLYRLPYIVLLYKKTPTTLYVCVSTAWLSSSSSSKNSKESICMTVSVLLLKMEIPIGHALRDGGGEKGYENSGFLRVDSERPCPFYYIIS